MDGCNFLASGRPEENSFDFRRVIVEAEKFVKLSESFVETCDVDARLWINDNILYKNEAQNKTIIVGPR